METLEKYNQADKNRDNFKSEFNALMDALRASEPKYAKTISGNFSGFYPCQQYFRIEALESKDFPWHIEDNGVFLEFKVDFIDKSVEVNRTGHINLSLEEIKATNLAAVGLKRLTQARGGKWMRKFKYKDTKQLIKRVKDFFESVMAIVNDYTGGYPYERGISFGAQ